MSILTRTPFRLDPPTVQEEHAALAATLRERAAMIDQCGESIIPRFTNPSVRELQDEERTVRDHLAAAAVAHLYGKRSIDSLSRADQLAIDGGAMYLVRRGQPAWMHAAHEQAVETLLQGDEFRALMRERSPAEARVIAHRLVTNVRAALIGVLENEQSVTPAVYLRLQAAKLEQGGR